MKIFARCYTYVHISFFVMLELPRTLMDMMGRFSLISLFSLSLASLSIPALGTGESPTIVFRSGPEQVHLIELFSTQSCSSCPPAQAWINRLERNPKLWHTFVPVVFHVDYWDYLGWKDPFSSSVFTQRQRGYAQKWSSPSIYTPMFVLDGSEWRSRASSEYGALGANSGTLAATSRDLKNYEVTYKTSSTSTPNLVLHIALLGQDIETKVRKGENAGKTLQHKFLVLEHQEKSISRVDGRFKTQVQAPVVKTDAAKKFALVFWVSEQSNSKVLQATGGLLPESGHNLFSLISE